MSSATATNPIYEARSYDLATLAKVVNDSTMPARSYLGSLREGLMHAENEKKLPTAVTTAILALAGTAAALATAPAGGVGALLVGSFAVMMKVADVVTNLKNLRESVVTSDNIHTMLIKQLETKQASQGMWESLMVKLGQRNDVIEQQANHIAATAQHEMENQHPRPRGG